MQRARHWMLRIYSLIIEAVAEYVLTFYAPQPTFPCPLFHSTPNCCQRKRLLNNAVISLIFLFFNPFTPLFMKRLFLLTCSIVALSSCDHDKDNGPAPTLTRTDLLTAKNWRVTALTTTSTSNGQIIVQDEYATFLACERDNFIKFNPNKTVLNNAGADKCDPKESQTSTLNWAFDKDETHLLLDDGSGTATPDDIVELSATTLHLQKIPVGSTGIVQDVTFTAL